MTHFEHGNAKEKHTILKQALKDSEKVIKSSQFEFCTMSRTRMLKGFRDRAETSLKDFEASHPEVMI